MSLADLRARLEGRRRELRAMQIAVLAGGGSSEREVSLRSGRAMLTALAGAGYAAQLLQLGADSLSLEASYSSAALTSSDLAPALEPSSSMSIEESKALAEAGAIPAIRQCDVVLSTLHGSQGENGAWQGLLELARVPYVSAGVKGSALAMDKITSKRLFQQLDMPTPQWWIYRRNESLPIVPASVTQLVAKPPEEGSSVGIEMVANDEGGWRKIAALSEQFDPLLIEERIEGRELTVGIIGPSPAPVALPVVEIVASGEFYDYDAKYGGESRYECPAQIDTASARQITDYALTIYREFDLGPFARVDCILDNAGQPYFLEANTLPGFTELSLLPMAAKAAGIEMVELLELLMICALERHEAQLGGRA